MESIPIRTSNVPIRVKEREIFSLVMGDHVQRKWGRIPETFFTYRCEPDRSSFSFRNLSLRRAQPQPATAVGTLASPLLASMIVGETL